MDTKLKKSRFHTIFWACFAAFLLILDIASKWIVQSNIKEGESVAVIPNFFYITLSYNTGIAFSIGAGEIWTRVLNILVSLVVSTVIVAYYVINRDKNSPIVKATLAVLGAGAIGNLVDRAFYWKGITGFDGVIDFLQFYLGGGPGAKRTSVNPFATFNVADACLTIGVIMFVIFLLVDIIRHPGEDLSKDPRKKESIKVENPTRSNGVTELNKDIEASEAIKAKESNEENQSK